jgi:hypothetical protein
MTDYSTPITPYDYGAVGYQPATSYNPVDSRSTTAGLFRPGPTRRRTRTRRD